MTQRRLRPTAVAVLHHGSALCGRPLVVDSMFALVNGDMVQAQNVVFNTEPIRNAYAVIITHA